MYSQQICRWHKGRRSGLFTKELCWYPERPWQSGEVADRNLMKFSEWAYEVLHLGRMGSLCPNVTQQKRTRESCSAVSRSRLLSTRDVELLERVQRRATEMIKGLEQRVRCLGTEENLSYEQRQRHNSSN